MRDRRAKNRDFLEEENAGGAGTALFDERAQSDERLDRERDVVDTAFSELERDTRVPRSTRAFLHRLRERVASLREGSDVDKTRRRHQTDGALLTEVDDRLDVREGLWEILTELDAIGNAVMSIREAPAGRLGEVDVLHVAGTVEVAANRIL
jgi:hypothetical protein